MKRVIDLATKQFALDINGTHGLSHWQKVENNAIEIASYCNANLRVVRHFAYLHDACRQDENDDPDHGVRAALWICDLQRNSELTLSPNEMKLLVHAIMFHNHGMVSRNPTIGACWDADRLDLVRVGITPSKRLLSTMYAKNLIRRLHEVN